MIPVLGSNGWVYQRANRVAILAHSTTGNASAAHVALEVSIINVEANWIG